MGESSGQKGFLEKFDDFARGLNEIDQRFNHRLAGKVLRFAEDYADGRFGIVAYLHRRGEPQFQRIALCLDSCLWQVGDAASIGTFQDQTVLKPNYVGCSDQHPVLIDVINFPKMPDERRIVSSFVRLYMVEDKGLGLWEGHMYRPVAFFGFRQSVSNGVLKLLPRFMSWKSYSFIRDGRVHDPRQPGPEEIYGTVEGMNRIAEMKRQTHWDELFGSDQDGRDPGLRISLYADRISVFCDDRINDLFDCIDVVFGPFNLEF